eukprot:3786494-Pleurochrysis_carterae.AAC.1
MCIRDSSGAPGTLPRPRRNFLRRAASAPLRRRLRPPALKHTALKHTATPASQPADGFAARAPSHTSSRRAPVSPCRFSLLSLTRCLRGLRALGGVCLHVS